MGRRVVPFIGLTLAAGVLNGGYTASEGALWGNGADGGVLIAIRAGVLIGRHELAIEVAPFTDFWDLYVETGPAFEANASYGYLVPLRTKSALEIAWPLRFGVGVLAGGDNTGDNASSFRYALTNGYVAGVAVGGVTTHYLTLLFGTSVSYLF